MHFRKGRHAGASPAISPESINRLHFSNSKMVFRPDRANQLDPVQQIARFINPLEVPVCARLSLGRFAATNYLNGYSSKLNFKKAPGI
jgi:hypothetical protein